MIDKLNEKLKRGLRTIYDPFILKMREHKKEINTVDDWIGNTDVRNGSKATFWAQPNSNLNSSNSRVDRPYRDTELQRNKKPRGGNWNVINKPLGIVTIEITLPEIRVLL